MSINTDFLTSTSFIVSGNYVDEFHTGRRIKAYCGVDGYRYGTVISSFYTNPNTIINLNPYTSEELTPNLTEVWFGIIGSGLNHSLPNHCHNGDHGHGGTFNCLNIGHKFDNDSWRIIPSGSDLVIERKESDKWTMKEIVDHGWMKELETFVNKGLTNTATTIITSSNGDAIQNAITSASNGDVIEIKTHSTYNPIILPSNKRLIIRNSLGYTPKISGQHGVIISNGTRDVLISGISFINCSTINSNWKGAAIALEHQGIFNKVVFYRCSFPEVLNGSAILLSYHQSISGDNYAISPVYPDDFSNKFGVIECEFFHACKDGIEGAAVLCRGVDKFYVKNCTINGNSVNSRGVMAQVCKNVWIENNRLHNFGSGNSEAIKIDRMGSTTEITTATILNNVCYDCVEGIDADDYVGVFIQGNLCYNCEDEGISVDNNAECLIIGNICHNCNDGIRADSGSIVELFNNCCFDNSNNNYRMDNGYFPDSSNILYPIEIGVAASLSPFFPTTSNNWYTSPSTIKNALDELGSRDNIQFKFVDFSYDIISPFNIGDALPDNSKVVGYMAKIHTVFNGSSNILEIGKIGDTSSVAASGEIDLTSINLNSYDKWIDFDSSTQIIGTLTVVGATQGSGSILLKYIVD